MGSSSLDPITNKAIDAALTNNWKEAIDLNLLLLEKYPNDVETRNRLARAYFESGKINKAKSLYKSVLKIDPYNSIASKNIKKLSEIKSFSVAPKENGQTQKDSPIANLFLEEPGKTKIVKLITSNSNKILAQLRTADPIQLQSKYNSVYVFSKEGHKIGMIDPVWGKKIAKALRIGCKFEAYVISVDTTQDFSVSIYVRVLETAQSLEGQTIFPIEKTEDFKPYVSEEVVNLITSDEVTNESEENLTSNKGANRNHSQTSLESLAEKEQAAYENLDEENQNLS